MGIFLNQAALLLRPLLGGLGEAMGIPLAGEAVDAVGSLLATRFADPSQRLPQALRQANDRAWKTVELAVAGNSLWERGRVWLATGDERALRQQMLLFLEQAPLPSFDGKSQFRQQCLRELQQARKANLLTADTLSPQELGNKVQALARFAEPQPLVEGDWALLQGMADELQRAGFANLAWLIAQRVDGDRSLLVLAARYFFRRALETDPELARGLNYQLLEGLSARQETGFRALQDVLAQHADDLNRMLEDVLSVTVQTRDAVLDLRQEMDRQLQGLNAQVKAESQHLYQETRRLLEQLRLQDRPIRPRDSLSIHNDRERLLVKKLLTGYRALPADQQQAMPALLNGLGKLQVAIGEFEGAQRDFGQVATLATSPAARAEAHFNAYRAALERQQLDVALQELLQAVQLDPGRHIPFPLDKYLPQRILGAGGFGVAFLCRHRFSKANVVVKALAEDDLDRDVDDVFAEAQALGQLDHPAIIRFQDCGYVDEAGKARPYLVMEYFEGATLDHLVKQGQPLAPEDLPALARPVAEALQAAHAKNIFHRDIKPANLLVRRDAGGWQAKLIDFGLALRRGTVESTVHSLAAGTRSLVATSLTGTLDYSAPEQMGKLPGVPIGPYSDVYGFGKTCYFALLGTPEPDDEEKSSLPDFWRKLLGQCTARLVEKRLPDFQAVAARLASLTAAPSAPRVTPSTVPPSVVLPEGFSPAGSLAVCLRPVFDLAAYPADSDPNARCLLELQVQRHPQHANVNVHADIVLLLDVSRSMKKEQRYPLLKMAVAKFVQTMGPDDRLAIVLFSASSDRIMPFYEGAKVRTRRAIEQILAAMDRSGSLFFGRETLLVPAFGRALELLDPDTARGAMCRIYVLTDGEIHDARKTSTLLAEFRARGVEIHAYGFGTEFNPTSLKNMLAGQLGGSVKPICDEDDIVNTFAHIAEVNRRLVARAARLSLEFLPQVGCGDAWTFQPQERYLGQIQQRQLVHEFGGLECDRPYALFFEVQLPPDNHKRTAIAQARLTWREGDQTSEYPLLLKAPRGLFRPGESLPAPDVRVEQAYTILNALRPHSGAGAELAALKARLELARLEGRDEELITALEAKIAQLEGREEDVLVYGDIQDAEIRVFSDPRSHRRAR